jgi:hypothetical protein
VASGPITVNVPTILQSANQLMVLVTDSIGCQEFQSFNCFEPSSTPTNTPTPTITPTNIYCNCTVFDNPTMGDLTFGYIDCEGTEIYAKIASLTTLYVCGKLPYADPGVIITVNNPCVENSCPKPTSTPTSTPTPTPTLVPIVGYFQDCCDPTNQFLVSNIPSSYVPLSGTYFINTSGFIGCVTSIGYVSTPNNYTYIGLGAQSNCLDCFKANPFYSCPPVFYYFQFTDCCSDTYYFYSPYPAAYYGFIPGEVTQVYNQTGLSYTISLQGCLTFNAESLTPYGGDILMDGIYSFLSPRNCYQCLVVNPYC